jgi:hypothetical protein
MAPDLLQDFLSSTQDEESRASLERLMGECAAPMVRRIVASRVRGPASDDVRQDVLLGLIARLHDVKGSGDWNTIGDFNAYVAGAAYHGCREYYRRCYPHRTRLRARLRYLLGTHSRFAMWKTSSGEWVCASRELLPADLPKLESKIARPPSHQLASWLESTLEELTTPLPFEELVERAGRHCTASSEYDTDASQAIQPAVTIEMRLTQRAGLGELWTEIGQLPLPQRVSLLLSIRDETGGPGLALFPAVGVANLSQIAAQLAMPAEKLALIWSGLPLGDRIIGEYLNLDSQRVINLRKSARERLNRKIKRQRMFD